MKEDVKRSAEVERRGFVVLGFKSQQIASKLLSVGILPGSRLFVIRVAPGGSVYYLKVDGVSVALRKNELAAIHLDKG